ncbi:hypothetical protein G6F65_015066 [Rhizopus arrhizus]|nr:hypothetical protein G6F41_012782 [Rhizopus arrhizus]KAG1085314.1 hypothetical protein G6F39_012787 [Rhizopus arrhizus]KAG1260411.1 hypothetical protein G6F65_015066 [Rhizopus arrhizus]
MDTLNYYNYDPKSIYFQQDNDPKHTSKVAKAWFEENNFDSKSIYSWPAQSPDLNPIEHVWHHLKLKLSAYETRAKGVHELWDRIEEQWANFTKDDCRNGRIARWVLDIWTYDFTVVHRREIDNADADALSRLMIPGDRKPVPRPTINSQVATTPLSLHNIRLEQARDSFVDAVSRQASPDLFAFRDGILYFLAPSGPVVVVPPVLRSAFLYAVHDDVTSGHLGREKTLDKALSSGWWPSIRKDTIDYVKGCERCQIHKMPTHKYRELKSIQVSLPGEIWAADIAYMPLSTRGNKYILVFMEYLTKWVITVPLPQFDTNAIVNVLIYAIILVNGTPQKFITDNGTNFISEAMKLVCQRLGINKVESSVEHPQTDGLVERMNRTVKDVVEQRLIITDIE